jgi:hypothetical protein
MQAAACAGGGSSAEDQDDSPRWRPFRGRGKGRRRLRTAPAEAAAFQAASAIRRRRRKGGARLKRRGPGSGSDGDLNVELGDSDSDTGTEASSSASSSGASDAPASDGSYSASETSESSDSEPWPALYGGFLGIAREQRKFVAAWDAEREALQSLLLARADMLDRGPSGPSEASEASDAPGQRARSFAAGPALDLQAREVFAQLKRMAPCFADALLAAQGASDTRAPCGLALGLLNDASARYALQHPQRCAGAELKAGAALQGVECAGCGRRARVLMYTRCIPQSRSALRQAGEWPKPLCAPCARRLGLVAAVMQELTECCAWGARGDEALRRLSLLFGQGARAERGAERNAGHAA